MLIELQNELRIYPGRVYMGVGVSVKTFLYILHGKRVRATDLRCLPGNLVGQTDPVFRVRSSFAKFVLRISDVVGNW